MCNKFTEDVDENKKFFLQEKNKNALGKFFRVKQEAQSDCNRLRQGGAKKLIEHTSKQFQKETLY